MVTVAAGPIEDGWVCCLHASDEDLDVFLRLTHPEPTEDATR